MALTIQSPVLGTVTGIKPVKELGVARKTDTTSAAVVTKPLSPGMLPKAN